MKEDEPTGQRCHLIMSQLKEIQLILIMMNFLKLLYTWFLSLFNSSNSSKGLSDEERHKIAEYRSQYYETKHTSKSQKHVRFLRTSDDPLTSSLPNVMSSVMSKPMLNPMVSPVSSEIKDRQYEERIRDWQS